MIIQYYYHCIENDIIYSIEELHKAYDELKEKKDPSVNELSFFGYIERCLTKNSGSLERIEKYVLNLIKQDLQSIETYDENTDKKIQLIDSIIKEYNE